MQQKSLFKVFIKTVKPHFPGFIVGAAFTYIGFLLSKWQDEYKQDDITKYLQKKGSVLKSNIKIQQKLEKEAENSLLQKYLALNPKSRNQAIQQIYFCKEKIKNRVSIDFTIPRKPHNQHEDVKTTSMNHRNDQSKKLSKHIKNLKFGDVLSEGEQFLRINTAVTIYEQMLSQNFKDKIQCDFV